MRFIFLFLLVVVFVKSINAQTPSKSEVQSQMKEAINELNKEIAKTEKQLTDANIMAPIPIK